MSVAFEPLPGGTVRWPRDPPTGLEGVQRTRVQLVEIAIVDAAVRRRVHLQPRLGVSMFGIGDRAA